LIFEAGGVKGVRYRDVLDGQEGAARAGLIINVAGPWVDDVLAGTPAADQRLIGGTKGSHIIVRAFVGAPRSALYLEAEADHRPFFIIPWAPGAGLDRADQEEQAGTPGAYLIGTTDIPFSGDPGEAVATGAEIDYLLRETDRVIPGAHLDRSSVRAGCQARRGHPAAHHPRTQGSPARRRAHFCRWRQVDDVPLAGRRGGGSSAPSAGAPAHAVPDARGSAFGAGRRRSRIAGGFAPASRFASAA
jgi:hypothetical protein